MAISVTITNLELRKSRKGDEYYFLEFYPAINGHTAGSVWDLNLMQESGVKEGDIVELDYAIKGKYLNIADIHVSVTGQSVGQSTLPSVPDKFASVVEIYKKCRKAMLEIWAPELKLARENVDLSACVNTLFINIMRRQ